MEVVSYIAESLNSVAYNLLTSANVFLQINFTVFSSIVNYVYFITKNVSDVIEQISTAIGCCVKDFVLFSEDVRTLVTFIVSSVTSFLFETCSQVSYGLSVFFNCTQLFCSYVKEIVCLVCDICYHVYAVTYDLISLIGTSVLLILQAGPNFIIFIVETIIYLVPYLLDISYYFLMYLVEEVISICVKSYLVIYTIPIKAYFGALLFIAIFYQKKYVMNFLKAYFVMMFALLKQIGISLLGSTCKCTKYVASISIHTFTKLKNEVYPTTNGETEIYYNATPHVSTSSDQSKKSILVKCLKSAKDVILKPPLLYRKRVEEQVQNLQKELIAEREKNLCVICFDGPKNTILYPCCHLCVCQNCSLTLIADLQGCPLCRHSIDNIYRVYI